jgi:hypothetical protein
MPTLFYSILAPALSIAPYRLFEHPMLKLSIAPHGTSRAFEIQNEVNQMLAIIAGVLLVLWLLGFTAFHVTSGFIHILLVLAVISILFHFFRGRAAV